MTIYSEDLSPREGKSGGLALVFVALAAFWIGVAALVWFVA
jgi:hypothetical protein